MANLNLTATNSREQIVLDNLTPMVSDVLADKINNGVYIEKDGKRLLNKKDLSTFMVYATEQARKLYNNQQQKGTHAVCVLGDDIMSWAIHYFEEDSIEGKLYNEDGTEYTPPKPVKATTKNVTPSVPHSPPAPKPKPQLSLFDLLDEKAETVTQEHLSDSVVKSVKNPETFLPETDSNPSIDEIADKLQQAIDEKNGIPRTVTTDGRTVDVDTGEVLDNETVEPEELTETEMRQFDGDIQEPRDLAETQSEESDEQYPSITPSSFDEDTAIYLLKLLDGKMDLA